MSKKIKLIASFIGIPVVPYVFILTMGVLKKEGLISTEYSSLIVVFALILFGFMIYITYIGYCGNKKIDVTVSTSDEIKPSQPESNSYLDLDTDSKIDCDTNLDLDLKPDLNLKGNLDTNVDLKSNLDSRTIFDTNEALKPDCDTNLHANKDLDLKSDLDSITNLDRNSELYLKLDPNCDLDDGNQSDEEKLCDVNTSNDIVDTDDEIEDVHDIKSNNLKNDLTDLLDKIEAFLHRYTLTKEEITVLEQQREKVIRDLVKYLVNEEIENDGNIIESLDIISKLLSRDDLTNQQRELLLAKNALLTGKPKELVEKKKQTSYSKFGLGILVIGGALAYMKHKKTNKIEEE